MSSQIPTPRMLVGISPKETLENFPHAALDKIELIDYLRVRGASQAYDHLRAIGIEAPNDLQFVYLEDLLEHGFFPGVS